MALWLVIRPLAEADLKEAVDWYNLQTPNLGDKFILLVDRKLKEIAHNPTHYQIRYKNVRTALVDRFPYHVHFELATDKIIVFAFYHTSRNSKKIRERLK